MRWSVSVDPRPRHDGPLRFASWLADRVSSDSPDGITGIHVLPRLSQLSSLWDSEVVTSLLASVESNCRRHLAEVTPLAIELDVREADDVPEGLADAARRHDAHCLVVARHARLEDDRLIRLGRVARKLLRNLPAPLAITPPSWTAPTNPGPVLLATDLLPHSLPAARLAKHLAARYHLPVAAAYVAHVFKWIGSGLPSGVFDRYAAQAVEVAEDDARSWLALHELDLPLHVAAGDPSAALAEIATRERAAFVVCGARSLSPMERLFHASVGADLAASMPCPVFVVPQSEPPRETLERV